MGTNWAEVNVQCPYFRATSDRCVRCEGAIPGTVSTTAFRSCKGRKVHMERLCCGRYWECPQYQAADRKYR